MTGLQLYSHQVKALGRMQNGCILKGGVGTGKSITAIAYFVLHEAHAGRLEGGRVALSHPEEASDLLIITTPKKRDSLEWQGDLAPFRLSTDPELSLGNIKVTIDSWNNIGRYHEFTGFVIFDEQRAIGSGSWSKSMVKIARRNRWVMLSATPGDTWLDYISVFLANGFYKNRSQFLQEHVVYSRFAKFPKVERYIEQGKLERLRRQILVDMPYARLTTRHSHNIIVDHDEELYRRVVADRWHVYENRPLRDVAEMFLVARKVVNNDISRLGAVMQLFETHPKMIVWYNFDYELQALRTVGPLLNMPMAEWNGHKHQNIPAEKRWLYLVQYTAGSEGWNCITTDTEVFYSQNYSYRVTEQAKGRIDRLNTQYRDLHYYTLYSNTSIDKAIRKALTTKQDFNERDYYSGGL